MIGTLIGVLLGGLISILSQITLDIRRARVQEKTKYKEITTAIRVIRFTLYSAEHVLKEALETGQWWSPSDELNVAAPGEDLRALASILPEEHWRIYTGTWRRLHDCIRRSEAARLTKVDPGTTDPHVSIVRGHSASVSVTNAGSVISTTDLQRILGAFITADDARRRLEAYVVETSTYDVPLDRICLTDQEIADAIDRCASRSVDKAYWRARLQSSASAS